MLAFIRNLFGKPDEAAETTVAGVIGIPEFGLESADARGGGSRSFAKKHVKDLALGKEGGRYRTFEARSDAGIRRLLGCGPTLNVDGTPMVGDTGLDERGRPYGVTEDFG